MFDKILSTKKSNILTAKATTGVTPPPPATCPGCWAPCGGNMFNAAGDIAATAAIAAAARAACTISSG